MRPRPPIARAFVAAASATRALAIAALLGTLASCSHKSSTRPITPSGPPRTFRMGFSPIPPKNDQSTVLPNLEMWTRRADGGIMHVPPPWDSLLAGTRPDSLVLRALVPIANYYRAKGLQVVITMDATDGLNRAAEAPALVAAGRSLTEASVQFLYKRYAVAIDSLVHPAYLGLAAETNLIRAAASPALYAAVKQVANDAATAVRALDPSVKLYVSVQVDVAWGALGGGPYVGIGTDLADFPFVQVVGLSAYPYLAGFTEPDVVPLDYYERLTRGTALPEILVEGGWTSASVGGVVSDQNKQARWIRHQFALLDSAKAVGVYQLTFTDLDTTGMHLPPGSILPLFASIGLVDANLVPKPALAPWDSAYARPLQ
jgi:hypothetical protein